MREESRLDKIHSFNMKTKNNYMCLNQIKLDLYAIIFTVIEYYIPIIWYLTPFSSESFYIYRLSIFLLIILLISKLAYSFFLYITSEKKVSTVLMDLSNISLDGSIYYGPTFFKTPTKNRSLSFSDSFKMSSKKTPESLKMNSLNSTQISPQKNIQNCSLFQLAFSPISSISNLYSGNKENKPTVLLSSNTINSKKSYRVSVPMKKTPENNINMNMSTYTQNQISPSRSFKERSLDQYWKSNGVDKDTLERWTLNLRRWLHGTIIKRVSNEISRINAKISSLNYEFSANNQFNMINPIGIESKVVVGKSSPDALLIASQTISSYTGNNSAQQENIRNLSLNLGILSVFLNISSDQEYVANRIKELSCGVCLEEFHWNNGSKSILHTQYNDKLPNDSIIILHLFSVYMDSRIPVSVNQVISSKTYPNNQVNNQSMNTPTKEDNLINAVHNVKPFSKTFTRGIKHTKNNGIDSQQKEPLDLSQRNKYDCIIHMISSQPPKLKLYIENEVYAVPEGPNGIFHALLAFFFYYNRLDNRIRMISLGETGINISWIFSK